MATKKSQIYYVTKEKFSDKEYLQDLKENFREEIKKENGTNIKIKLKVLSQPKIDITNPIENAGSKDAFCLDSFPKQFYLRFGYLLQYIHENVTPRIKLGDNHDDNPQMFDIDFSTWENVMYSLPNQISLDPRVCLVRNSNFYTGNPNKNTQVFQELLYFRQIDNGKAGSNSNVAYTMNIYLNFDFILGCLKPDDKGDVSVFEFLSSICTGLNKALGGINNLEPVIDESSNTLSILDTTPIPGVTSNNESNYVLQVYGYDKVKDNYISNFVRNVDLKTAITPEFATMITIGATAGGYVKGTEATAFSKWNTGLTDRFKEELTPGNENSVQKTGTDNEAETNYYTEFSSQNGYITRYGLTSLTGNFKLNTDAIERNLSVVTEYYKFILAKEAKNQSTSGGTIGFVPFKLNLTLDGISGIKIYNKLSVNTEFLPKAYGEKADLIVTGVSHNLSNNDWTTQIETTLIPKTGKQLTVAISPEVIQEATQNAISLADCAIIPSIDVVSGFGAVKPSTTDFTELIKIVIESQEGTYYHPLQSIDFKTNQLTSNQEMKYSGETLWGIDRAAGQQETTKEGRDFWSEVDKISGYGYYGSNGFSKSHTTIQWAEYRKENKKTKEFTIQQNPWKRNSQEALPSKLPTLFKLATENFLAPKIKSAINLYFNQNKSPNAQTVKNLVYSDGRLLYMHIRSWYSGVGNLQKDVNSIIKIYDSGVRNVETLACKELGARWKRRGDNAIAHKSHKQIKALIGLK
jgi:hypothetical protein